MEIVTPIGLISITDLVEQNQAVMYNQSHTTLTDTIFTDKRAINPIVIENYTRAFEQDRIEFRRSGNFPESEITGVHPPLLEVLAWWISFTKRFGQHGMRSFVTPSSTFKLGKRLGVNLRVNECLTIGPTSYKHDVVSPT